MIHDNEQMIKPEQDSKVENHSYCCPWIEKEKHEICIIHYTTKYNGKNITVIKTTMGVLAKDQVTWQPWKPFRINFEM